MVRSMKKVIISNSNYSHLWDIINDYTENNVLVCSDSFKNYNFKHKTFIYNGELNYVKRLVEILNNVEDEYIVLFSDVDIIIHLDESVLSTYKELMVENNIDRISFGVFNKNKEILEKNGLVITSINNITDNHFFTPYDYTPSIYKTKSLLRLCESFPNETYSNFETNEHVQNFVNENFKFYALQKSQNLELVYHRGFVYSNNLNFLHITTKGMLLNLDYYYDLKYNLLDILKKYQLNLETTNDNRFISRNEI
jgi:hypothetical protein